MMILKDFIKKIILSQKYLILVSIWKNIFATNLAITRSGSSILAELTNEFTFISVPYLHLPITISLKMLFIIKKKT